MGETKAGSKFRREMVGGSRLSEDEIALKSLQAYNNEAKDLRVYNRIRNYAGGTLYLVEFTNTSGGQDYWSVLIRGGESQVFYDHEMALREAVMWNRKISAMSLGSIVTAGISVAIVGVFLYFAVHDGNNAPQSLNYALSSVLGFWFGKSVSGSGRDRVIEV